jgi:hypothetical protein
MAPWPSLNRAWKLSHHLFAGLMNVILGHVQSGRQTSVSSNWVGYDTLPQIQSSADDQRGCLDLGQMPLNDGWLPLPIRGKCSEFRYQIFGFLDVTTRRRFYRNNPPSPSWAATNWVAIETGTRTIVIQWAMRVKSYQKWEYREPQGSSEKFFLWGPWYRLIYRLYRTVIVTYLLDVFALTLFDNATPVKKTQFLLHCTYLLPCYVPDICRLTWWNEILDTDV